MKFTLCCLALVQPQEARMERIGEVFYIMQHEVLLQPIAADDNQPWLTDACGVTPDTCGVSLDIGGVALDTCAVALDTCAVALDTYGVDLMPPVV